MGAVRGRKDSDPTDTRIESCAVGSDHRFEVIKERDLGGGAKRLEVRCKLCRTAGIVWTKKAKNIPAPRYTKSGKLRKK